MSLLARLRSLKDSILSRAPTITSWRPDEPGPQLAQRGLPEEFTTKREGGLDIVVKKASIDHDNLKRPYADHKAEKDIAGLEWDHPDKKHRDDIDEQIKAPTEGDLVLGDKVEGIKGPTVRDRA